MSIYFNMQFAYEKTCHSDEHYQYSEVSAENCRLSPVVLNWNVQLNCLFVD